MTKETTNTNTTNRTYTDTMAKAQTLADRWATLITEGESTTEGITQEAHDHLTGYTDYTWEAWEGNEDLADDIDTWQTIYTMACEMWLEKHNENKREEDAEETRLVLTKEEVQALRYTLDDIADVYTDLGEDDLIDDDMGIEQIHRMADVLRGILGRLPKED